MQTRSSLPSSIETGPSITRRAVLRWLVVGLGATAGFDALAGLQLQAQLATQPAPLIAAIQERLTVLGYSPGAVDGKWGPRTRDAFAEFCRRAGLPVTDHLTREHVRALWDVEFDPETASIEESVAFLRTIGVRF